MLVTLLGHLETTLHGLSDIPVVWLGRKRDLCELESKTSRVTRFIVRNCSAFQVDSHKFSHLGHSDHSGKFLALATLCKSVSGFLYFSVYSGFHLVCSTLDFFCTCDYI